MTEEQANRNWFANSVGMILVIFLCTTTFYLTYKVVNTTGDMSDKSMNILVYILGFLTAKLSTTVDWSFGTSSATKKQGEIIATQASTIAAAQDKLPPLPGASPVIPVAAGDSVTVKADP